MGIIAARLAEASTEVLSSIPTLDNVKDTDPGVIKTYLEGLVPNLFDFALQMIIAIVVYIIGTKIIDLIRKILRKWMDRRDADTGVKQFLDALVKYACYFILIMLLLSLFGIGTTSAVAVLGSVGLTIGLALQGSLSNFAGGVLLLLLKPFKVGDYIIEDTYKNEGTVKEISIFYTKLVTVDNKTIVIPNGNLANCSLTNVTQCEKRRLDISVGVSYHADLKKTKEVIYNLLMKENNRLEEEEVSVFISDLEDSSVKVGIRIWVLTGKYWETRWRLLEEIKTQLDANSIEIPFPQMDIMIKK